MKTLKVVGVLYVLSGLWCMFQNRLAGAYVGFDMSGALQQAEFFTVYGGLQLGLGLGMLLGSRHSTFQFGTLFMALVFSVTLLAARLLSLVIYPEALDHVGVWMMAELEFVIALALGIAYFRFRKKEPATTSLTSVSNTA